MALTLPIRRGASRDFRLQSLNPDGLPATGFGPSDDLAARVWAGGDQPTLASPSVSWIDAAAASFTVGFQDADTSALDPGTYRLEATASRGGRTGLLTAPETYLEVAPGPGTATAPRSYASAQDLRDHVDWIDTVQGPFAEAGFLRQRARATSWLDDILVGRYDVGSSMPTIGTPGFGAWSVFGGRDLAPSVWLRARLDAGLLIVRDLTREIVAHRALALICQSQMGRAGDNPFFKLAAFHRGEATDLVKTYRAELDLDGDGYAEVVIDCGSTSVR